MSKNAKKLFEQFQPSDYKLNLRLDKSSRTFSGSVVVTGKKVGRPSKRLTFHQKGLKITDCKIVKLNKGQLEEVNLSRINNQDSFDEVRLHSTDQLYPGNYEVSMSFNGNFSNDMLGLYESTFELDGNTETIVATQFESHHARKVFPCIDEPLAKATFELTVSTPADDVILSNTFEVSSSISQDGLTKQTTFERTPIMSTYLLAFATGKMHSVESKAKDGTIVRSWASLARDRTHLQYSVDEAVKILDYFSEYFKTPFPLKKCDLVALPDFDVGAMENWGLITFREVVMLADPKNRSISSEQYVSLVVSHELSHQWFGNLVTMNWWDDLWLNESFASLMEHVALDSIHPDWNQWELYTSMDVLSTTSRDIYKDIQPVGIEVNDPDIIETLFDPGIVYAKGGRLLKMLREHIGDEDFRTGLQAYFKKHAYGNTSRNDLWSALSQSSGKDLNSLMDSWISKPGMPMLHVKNTDDGFNITQERFMLDNNQEDDTIWPIPLLGSKTTEPAVINKRTNLIKASPDTLLNVNGSGHFIAHYKDAEQMRLVAKALNDNTMRPEGRINTLNDQYLLAKHGDISLIDALEIVVANKSEDRDTVWGLMLRILGACVQLTEGDESSEASLKKLKKSLAKPHFQLLGWSDEPGDDPNIKQLRRTVAAVMIGSDDNEALSEALDIFDKAESPDKIASEMRGIVLSAAVRKRAKPAIDQLIKLYPKSTPDMQHDISGALSSNKDASLAGYIIDKCLGQNGIVKPQDLTRWLVQMLRNHHTRDTAWNWITDNWSWIDKTIGTSKSFDFMPTYMAGVISSSDGKQKYLHHFEPLKENKVLSRNIQLGLVDIDSKIAWRQRDEQKVKDFLAKY